MLRECAAHRRPEAKGRKHRVSYTPGDSFLHHLHPLVKLAWLVSGTIGVFVVRSPWAVLALVALQVPVYTLIGVRLARVRGVRLFATTALLLGGLQLLFVRDGTPLLHVGSWSITTGGLHAALYIAGRFLSVILMSYLFVLTTEPGDLAYALMRAGVPYRYGFALITALRLVPIFEQEGQIVYKAQLARGVEYDIRSPRRFVTLVRQFFLPLLISALGKVDALAVSMEGRAFGKYPTRTFLREVRVTRRDYVALAVLVLAVIGLVIGSSAPIWSG